MFILLAIILFFLIFRHKVAELFYLLEKFELHHKLLTFLATIILAILFVRIGANIYDPNPLIFGFEIHHFDYGMIMLLILMVLLIFDRNKKRYPVYLLLSGVSLGLVIDQLYFIRRQDVFSPIEALQSYNSNVTSVIVLFVFIFLLTIIVNHKKRK